MLISLPRKVRFRLLRYADGGAERVGHGAGLPGTTDSAINLFAESAVNLFAESVVDLFAESVVNLFACWALCGAELSLLGGAGLSDLRMVRD